MGHGLQYDQYKQGHGYYAPRSQVIIPTNQYQVNKKVYNQGMSIFIRYGIQTRT